MTRGSRHPPELHTIWSWIRRLVVSIRRPAGLRCLALTGQVSVLTGSDPHRFVQHLVQVSRDRKQRLCGEVSLQTRHDNVAQHPVFAHHRIGGQALLHAGLSMLANSLLHVIVPLKDWWRGLVAQGLLRRTRALVEVDRPGIRPERNPRAEQRHA
jgi:hypothetical protein